MIVRLATLPDEYETLETFLNEHWTSVQTQYRAKLIEKSFRGPLVLCSEREGSLRGLIAADKAGDNELTLHKIVVDSRYRHQGIASELLLEFTQMLDEQGLSSSLFVGRERGGLQKLYSDFGYASLPESIMNTASHICMERPSIYYDPNDFS